MPPLRDRIQSNRGDEVIEFALIFPVLLIVLAGMFDFGLAINQYAIVTNAAREGARVAAMPGWQTENVEARVAAYAEASGLDPAALDTTVDFDAGVTAGSRSVAAVKVSVTYAYDYMLIDSLVTAFGGDQFPDATLTLKADSTMRKEVAAGL
jgi:Flp pilus assembly protein TadG